MVFVKKKEAHMKKCRAYDKHFKIVRGVRFIDYPHREVMYYTDEIEGNEKWSNLPIVRNFDEVNIMWSTGLKDENKVEIYESDLVEYRDGEESFKGEVVINCFGSYVKTKNDYIRFEDFSDENTRLAGNCYVVGNIYEDKK